MATYSYGARVRPQLGTRALLLFVVLLACFTYFFPRWADWNQNSRFALVLSIVDDGVVTIDRYADMTGDYALVDGHVLSDKAPGTALLGVPVYAAFKQVVPDAVMARLSAASNGSTAFGGTLRREGSVTADRLYFFVALAVTTFFTVAVPSAALGVGLFSVARELGCTERQAFAIALCYGLATPAFPYANSFVGHQIAAALLFGAFAVLFAVRRGGLARGWLVPIGFLLGYAAITEYPSALIAGLLGLYALLALPRPVGVLVRLAIGALPPVLVLAVYDLVAFGTPLPVGYAHSALWTDVHSTGFMSLTYPRLDSLLGLLFGVHRGLLFLSPFLAFAVPGYVALWKRSGRRLEWWVLLLAPLTFLLFNASSAMWTGGFSVGPRYLTPSLPFLALAAGLGLVAAWRRLALRPIVVSAVTWSFLAIWTETIGGQAFPDYTANPLLDYSLPKLLAGDVARNAGMAIGLAGWSSLLPLAAFVLIALIAAESDLARWTRGSRARASRAGGQPGWLAR